MDRNIALIERSKQGDKEALDIFCRENMRLVQSLAVRFTGRGTELCDLIQIGSVGLLKAIANFDLSRGLKFSTYAVPVITGEIKRFLRDDGIIKVSRGLKERSRLIANAEEELRRHLNREPTLSEIASQCNISVGELTEALEACTLPESIDAPATDNLDLSERIGFSEEDTIINKISMAELLSSLTDREKQVIILRYFEDKTQSQTARLVGVSQVHISRIEKAALLKLRSIAAE
ncbi:MAG: sigma-70 family RNA polymerase sigma factor [Clostridia bacterium]|nr:sigma-70 family RNA polymerase sigma factor [Clostridia bacterium]